MNEARRPFGIPTYTLKLIAVVSMFLDHFAVVFGEKLYPALPFLNPGGTELLRVAGRIAFPLFAFTLAIGATYTKNVYKYMGRLLAFVAVSEIPFDLARTRAATLGEALRAWDHQNVFATLFLGLLCIFVYEKLRERKLEFLAFLLLLFAAFAAEEWIKCDYGAMGVMCIFLFYISYHAPNGLRQAGIVLTCAALCFILAFSPSAQPAVSLSGVKFHIFHMDVTARLNPSELGAMLAAPLILAYSGEQGSKKRRWFFYAFYPAHLLLLWLALALVRAIAA